MFISIKQQTILKTILNFVQNHNYSPTVREICALTGLKSPSTAQGYLKRLKKHGLVDWVEGKPRTLKIVR